MNFASALCYHAPFLLLPMHGAALVAAWRFGSKTTRAVASVLLAAALLHSLAWLIYGPGLALHALCSLIGLGFILPIVLRSRRFYPLAVGATAMLSAFIMVAQVWLPTPLEAAAELLAALANLALLTALAAALWADWSWDRRRRARAQPAPATDERSGVGNPGQFG